MRSVRLALLSALAGLLVVLASSRDASAMPMFARKYKMACTDCHDALTYPRLNRTGYKFRRAGYRMPEQIGQEELSDYNITDAMAARITASYTASHSADDAAGTSDNANSFHMDEINAFPVTGSFMKNFASSTEVTFVPGEGAEVEVGYLRGVWGDKDTWFEARAGMWKPFEGFGASDRPYAESRPLFEEEGAASATRGDTLVRVFGDAQPGVEAGLQWQDTSVSLAVTNGINTETDGTDVIGSSALEDGDNRKDLLVFANQFFGERSGVSAYYSHGTVNLPVDPAGFVAGTSAATFKDNFDRLALFGTFGTSAFTALAGGELGLDQDRDAAGGTSRFKSAGAFVEGDVGLAGAAVGYLRLDYYDPNTAVDTNELLEATLGASIYKDWVSLVPELQWRTTKNPAGDATDLGGVLYARVIY